MILKKPYAFLIKYFRIIHIGLALFIILSMNNFSKITKFFNSYVKNDNQIVAKSFSRFNLIAYIFIIIIIVFSLLMFILMKKKKKPVLFYLAIFIYYIILLIAVIVADNTIKLLTETVLTQQASRIYRDIFLIVSLPQYYFLVTSIIRGVGFDIKKFNFHKDLKELEIESADNEEFEFLVGIDTQLYKRKVRRALRELKYYLLENKIFIFAIGLIVLVPIILYVFINVNFINKTYKIGNTAKGGTFNYKLVSAYQTNLNYNGKIINKNKKFIILEFEIKNLTSISKKIDNISMYLQSGKKKYYNKPSLKSHFLDIGNVYNNENIPANSIKNYIFVFEIENNNKNKIHYLNILNNIKFKDEKEIYDYSKFKIKPINLDIKPKEIEHQLNENIRLENKIFNNSTIMFKEIELVSTYEYSYEECKNNVCSTIKDIITPKSTTTNNLLILTYDLKLNDPIIKRNSISKHSTFFNAFLTTDPKTIEKNIIINSNIKNKVFIEVPKTFNNKYQVIIKTRNETHYLKYNF